MLASNRPAISFPRTCRWWKNPTNHAAQCACVPGAPTGVGRILRLCAVEFRGETLQRSKGVNVRISAAKKLDKLMTKCSVCVCHSESDAGMPDGVAERRLSDLGLECDFALAIGEDVAHATDLRANAAQLLFNPLISAVDMVNAVEDGLAVGNQSGEHQGSRGA